MGHLRPGPFTVAVGARIRARRERARRSLRDVAAACGWDSSMLVRVETGKTNITVEQLARLAGELGCAPATFLQGLSLPQSLGQGG